MSIYLKGTKEAINEIVEDIKHNHIDLESIEYEFLNEYKEIPKLIEFNRNGGKREPIKYKRIILTFFYNEQTFSKEENNDFEKLNERLKIGL